MIQALAEGATTFDPSTITTPLSEGALAAIQNAVPGLVPVIVATTVIGIVVKLFKRFAK